MEAVIPKVPRDEYLEIPKMIRDSILKLLKVVKNLAMDPTRRDSIVDSGLIHTLVMYIDFNLKLEKVQEINNQALHSLYLLCQLSRKRNAGRHLKMNSS